MSAAMYAAPVNQLRKALEEGELGVLNPVPWAVMTGNAIAWCAYAYYSWNPFVLASNIPGLIVSIWLNIGASKLQYVQRRQELEEEQQLSSTDADIDTASSENDDRNDMIENGIFVSQETLLLRILIVWCILLVCVGWLDLFGKGNEKEVVGILANINVIFFYGAPLQTMRTVIEDKTSESILIPTMIMNIVNTFFWILYGLAINDPVIYVPNIIGFVLGLIQALLCILYPTTNERRRLEEANDDLIDPLLQDFHGDDEASLPMSNDLL